MDSRARAFDITVHLLPHEQDYWIPKIKADLSSYPDRYERLLIGGPELAPNAIEGSGRHVHVYCSFDTQRKAHQVIALLHLNGLKYYLQPAKKIDWPRIRAHHCKQETKESQDILKLIEEPEEAIPLPTSHLTEDGLPPKKKAKVDQQVLRQLIEAGDIEGVKDLNYHYYLQHKSVIESEANKNRPEPNEEFYTHYWIHGAPGTGKTPSVKLLCPGAYYKNLGTQSWEEYSDEVQVVLEDMDPRALYYMGVQKLKTLCDPIGVRCDVKYGSAMVKAQVIVTSNYSLYDCMTKTSKCGRFTNEVGENDVNYLALLKRFKVLTVNQWLYKNNIQLKGKAALKENIKNKGGIKGCFEPYTPEGVPSDPYSEVNYVTPSEAPSSTITTSTFVTPYQVDDEEDEVCHNSMCGRMGIFTGEGIHQHRKHNL